MIVTLEEMKQYLRVDFDDDDSLIETLITSATRLAWISQGRMKMSLKEVRMQSLLSFMR